MTVTTTTTTRSSVTVTGATWAMVRAALTPTDEDSVPGYADNAGRFWYNYARGACVDAGWDLDIAFPPERHVVLVARDPGEGNHCEWSLAPGALAGHVPYVSEAGGAGWDVVGVNMANHLHYQSGWPGSSIQADRDDDGSWTLILDVPVVDGQPERNRFWASFHAALESVECLRCGTRIPTSAGDLCDSCVTAVAN